jgi:hypothetical protein
MTDRNRLIAEKVLGWKNAHDGSGRYIHPHETIMGTTVSERLPDFTESLDLCHKYILPQIVKDGRQHEFGRHLYDLICPIEATEGTCKEITEIVMKATAEQIVTATLKAYGLED